MAALISALIFLASMAMAQGQSTGTVSTSLDDELKISNLGKAVRELESGRPRITGLPTFANGIKFSDGTTQTTAATSSVATDTTTFSGTSTFTGLVIVQSSITYDNGTVQRSATGFIGSRTIHGGGSTNFGAGNVMSTRHKAAHTMTIGHMSFFSNTWANGAKAKVAVYASLNPTTTGDRPDGAPLAQSSELTSNGQQDSEHFAVLTTSTTITAGSYYWLSFHSDTDAVLWQKATSVRTTLGQYQSQAYASGFPSISGAGIAWYGMIIAAFP